MNKQTEALKMAIEALESIELLCDDKKWYLIGNARKACKEALEQPAQEPVGQVLQSPVHKDLTIATFNADKVPEGTPLYTHPAPLQNEFAKTKSWQGLSDDERETILGIKGFDKEEWMEQYSMMDLIGDARAIEQALKEKNNGNS